MKIGLSLVHGVIGYIVGEAVAAALVLALSITVYNDSGDPRGGEDFFKIAWTAFAFGVGPLGAALFPLAIGGRRASGKILALSVIVALTLYGLTAWALAESFSVLNDCNFGVAWPDTSVPGCD